MRIKCAAKLNLYLAVTGKRDDGFHDIETYFQPVSLHDVIDVLPAKRGIELHGDSGAVRWDSSNLCFRAAKALFERVGFEGGVILKVQKAIPPGKGLGGGSSDAAGVLLGLNEYFGFGLSRADLADLALKLGSDVPFFIFGRPAIGRGRGEILEEAAGLPQGTILLIFPPLSISTAEAFKKLNLMLTKSESGYKLRRLIDGLDRFPESKVKTYNSFRAGVVESYPEMAQIFAFLRREEEAVFFSLSGSGSACFIVYEKESEAREALKRLSGKGYDGLLVEPVDWTIEIGLK